MWKYCEQNKILEPLQFGSQKRMSAVQALITMKTVIDDATMHKRDLHVYFLDVQTAFDLVPFEMLQRTLTYYKMPDNIIRIIMNLYKDNKANLQGVSWFPERFFKRAEFRGFGHLACAKRPNMGIRSHFPVAIP